MEKLTANLITGLLVIVIGFLMHVLYIQDKEEDRNFMNKINETELLLEQSNKQRDSLNTVVDSLRNSGETLALKIEEKDRQIRAIKGRYDKVPQDSLALIMDKRAAR